MNFTLNIDFPKLNKPINYTNKIVLLGSCFTEHITHFLHRAKFKTMQNSHGIVFNPLSVCKAIDDVMECKDYNESDLFLLNEYWNSWYHHSDFSYRDKSKTLDRINQEIKAHHAFLKTADTLFITLGSAFAYNLIEQNIYVSNNHRAPSQWFRKELLSIETISTSLVKTLSKLKKFNPTIKVVFTISPVRHIRDGVIENNRSKARLLEAVHNLEDIYYFPSYELVIDILRDYRFYDMDMVHPNYQATAYVWEQFVSHCIDPECLPLMKQLEQIYKARHHRSKDTGSEAHRTFLQDHLELCNELKHNYPYLELEEDIDYFSTHSSR